MKIKNAFIHVVLLGALMLASCSTPKNITYVQGFNTGDIQQVKQQGRIKVQADDRLSIVVTSKDPALAQVFNLAIANMRLGQMGNSGVMGSSNTNSDGVAAYTVTPDGYITFPVLGQIRVAGLERSQVAEKIKDRLISENLLKDPIVTVEFLNATVSIIGDVTSPGQYAIDRDNLNILQAISKAGDLKITGQRENVLVIREENGKDCAYRVDLTNTAELMSSPAYYLQQNDIIYVEPNDMAKRQAVNNANTLMTPSFWMSVCTFVMSIVVLIVK